MGVLDSPPDALDEALLRMLSTALDGSASGHLGRHVISACITEQPKRSVSIVAQSMPARLRALTAPPECPPGWNVAPPDFIGIGAQRCGTTWWDGLITDHPGVCRPEGVTKELHFFDRFVTTPVPDSLAADYARWFPRPSGLLAGEWTPRYMLDFWTPRLLARCAPEAKLIVCLRDPVERFSSGMALQVASANHVLRGLYHLQLRRVLEYFSREQILILQYEKCLDDPAGELRRTYRFLGLAPDGHRPPALCRRINASEPGAKPALQPHAREDLIAVLLDDVRALAAVFPEIDLDRWPAFAALARNAG
jgi:hypothetical protein